VYNGGVAECYVSSGGRASALSTCQSWLSEEQRSLAEGQLSERSSPC
jgi:hypothetical protein